MGEGNYKLGKCCSCLKSENVRNMLALPKRAPVPGTGWGCVVCETPSDGAVAVVCDACLESKARVQFVCVGHPYRNERRPVDLVTEPFDHDYARHPEQMTQLWHEVMVRTLRQKATVDRRPVEINSCELLQAAGWPVNDRNKEIVLAIVKILVGDEMVLEG